MKEMITRKQNQSSTILIVLYNQYFKLFQKKFITKAVKNNAMQVYNGYGPTLICCESCLHSFSKTEISQLDVDYAFMLEILAHNPVELHEHLKQRKKCYILRLTVTFSINV